MPGRGAVDAGQRFLFPISNARAKVPSSSAFRFIAAGRPVRAEVLIEQESQLRLRPAGNVDHVGDMVDGNPVFRAIRPETKANLPENLSVPAPSHAAQNQSRQTENEKNERRRDQSLRDFLRQKAKWDNRLLSLKDGDILSYQGPT
jgi:hypothetical protein